ELGGTNNTYNLTGANLKLDTRDLAGFGRALGHDSGVRVVKVTGSNNTINGLNLTGYDLDTDTSPGARRYADWSAIYVQLTGLNNTMDGVDVVTRGSNPYGYGDVFGKGARVFPQGEPADEGGLPWIHHNKTSAFNVFEATGAVVNGMNLQVKTFGHGFFVQKSSDTTLTNSTVTGELFSSNDIINLPFYQEYGFTSHGNELPPDIMISGGEDGVRMYGSINGVPSVGLTVDNVTVTNMRSAFSTALGFTDLANGLGINLNNVEAYGAEVGFGLGSLTNLTNAKGDITNGPLIHFPYNNVRDTTVDVELVGDVPVGLDYAVAYLNGQRLDVTIESDLPAGALPQDSMVRIGQTFFNNWRDTLHPTGPESADPGDFIDSTFVNNTNQMVVLGNLATNNVGSSRADVISNGKDNAYDGITRVMAGSHLLVTDTMGLGNNGTANDGSLESNATVVELGATLELESGIRITDEMLTISGAGVDGRGALYTDGTVSSDTRFGSSVGSDESTIFLDGDASIGVGVAGNQLNVGRIQGQGTLTKLGPGTLAMGKSSTYEGDLVVAEGTVLARPRVVHRDLLVGFGASIVAIGDDAFRTDGDVVVIGTMDLNGRTDNNSLDGSVGRLLGPGQVISSNPTPGVGATLSITTDSGQGAFSGSILDNINIIKSGNGTQILSGASAYTGTTTIVGGTLLVDGMHSGGDQYVVNAGTLGGTGTIGSDLIVRAGASFAPGQQSPTASDTLTFDF
ncbi:MAG: autotransporter-associated beta strand repeat-containing protein, partial [Planctomycetota bacterium]